MRSAAIVSGLLAVGCLFVAERAEACGGCFAPPGPSTQVTAHRMAFAVSSKRTVLWDQIQYVGAPTDFGWVLPIRGKVDVGVSSDQLFDRLEGATQPIIDQPPAPSCPEPTKRCRMDCSDSFGGSVDGGLAADDTGTSSVDVWSTSVVGPYEATQLSATDSTALKNWLKDHGYTLPDAIVPVIDKYIVEGFGFLAIKLVPNTVDTSRMVPIRIGFDGASPTLPLRMIAAGSGAKVGIKLFVLGDGRWESKNFAAAEVKTADLVWDWRAMASNYGSLEIKAIDDAAGKVFVTETSDEITKSLIVADLPPGTATTEAGTMFSTITDETELDTAFPSSATVTVTRLFAELPSSSLGVDLELQASTGGKIPQRRMPPKSVGFTCQDFVDVECPGVSPTCDGSSPIDPVFPSNGGTSSSGGSFGCATRGPSSPITTIALAFGAAFALGALRRRRK
ncbi:MAG: DUF2330 domain-containing protein [Polyangiales bacterium]